MSLVENERVKLLAAALDRFSTVCLTVGFAAPLSNMIYGTIPASFPHVLVEGGAWIFVAIGLHFGAKRTLRALLS